MEKLASVCSIDSDFVNLSRVVPEVFDVAEDVSSTVLANEVSEMSPETHVCNGGFVKTPILDGEAFEEDKSFSVE